MKKKKNKFKFSVVIPVYNVENYLEETILSVINQTLDFKKLIQIILVNDGSPDNSEAICIKYHNLYPDNIIYIKQENRGVSAARNNGMQYACGEYINFLDSDDTWEPDAFNDICSFTEKNPDIEILCCKMKFFEASNKFHPLCHKFTDTRIVNIEDKEEYNSIHLHVTSSFFKTEYAKTLQFEENMILGEDGLYLNKLILKAGRYAAMANIQHNYRKRQSQSSAIQTKESNIRFYKETVQKFYGSLIQTSLKIYNSVIPYVQNLLVYDIGWRVRYGKPDVLTQAEYNDYCADLSKVLSYVDDQYILKNSLHKSIFKKSAMIQLKYGEDALRSKLIYNNEQHKIYFNNVMMANVPKNTINCEIYNVEHQGSQLLVEGLVKKWIIDADCTTDFVLAFADNEYPVELKNYPHTSEETMFGKGYKYYQFSVLLPFDEKFGSKKIRWIYPRLYFGKFKCNMGMSCGGRRMLNTKLCSTSYKIMDDYYYFATNKGLKFVKPSNMRRSHFKLELKMLMWLFKNKHMNIIRLRIIYYILSLFKKKPLWIISDRPTVANDNGEAFFCYLSEKNPKDLNFEFVINRDCPDAKRMKKFGKVVYFGTLKYKLHFLLADKIISSQANDFIMNAFTIWDNRYIRDLCTFDFVFLQHGIILNDLSSWLQKRNKKIDLFVTSAKAEQQSIVNGEYGLDENKVILTGLPRFDRLYNQKSNLKKQILIMPTWRRSITQSYDKDCNSVYYDKFNQTDYFNFFNNLINDEKLLSVMREYGYTGKFCLHPIHAKQAVDYNGNDVFSVVNGTVNYQSLFSESALMITDFSSTFFDFCYLNKPVIYAQFDRKEFYEGQIYDEGYFDYARDGFGPVCSTYEETLEQLITSIKNGCITGSDYAKRIQNFYSHIDNHNCDRIYSAIRNMDK